MMNGTSTGAPNGAPRGSRHMFTDIRFHSPRKTRRRISERLSASSFPPSAPRGANRPSGTEGALPWRSWWGRGLSLLLLTTYRYLHVISQEYRRLRRSAAMRCFRPATNLHTYRTYSYLIGMTIVRSHERSQRIYNAMRMRGFTGQLPSPLALQQPLQTRDFLVMLALVGATFILFTLDRLI